MVRRSRGMDEQLNFVLLVAERLAAAGLEYMLTGSMAMAAYGHPRMTRDVDFVVDCAPKDVDAIVRSFERDCYISRDAVSEAVASRSMFNAIHNEWVIKADFIVRKDDGYHQTEFERRRELVVGGAPLAIVSLEDLILSKLIWARQSESELQLRDVREILATGIDVDRAYLDHWASMLGVTWSPPGIGDG